MAVSSVCVGAMCTWELLTYKQSARQAHGTWSVNTLRATLTRKQQAIWSRGDHIGGCIGPVHFVCSCFLVYVPYVVSSAGAAWNDRPWELSLWREGQQETDSALSVRAE